MAPMSDSVGMAISVTQLEVVADSALVSVLRTCRQHLRGRETTYQLEPTWLLRRVQGRWVVRQTRVRVT